MSLPPPPPSPSAPMPPPVPPTSWGQTRPPRPACPVGAWLMIGGAVVMVVGSLLTWFEIAGESVSGFDELVGERRDGPAFTAFAVILAGFGIATLAAKRILPIAIIAVIVASFSVLAAFADINDVNELSDAGLATTGPGLPVVLVGSLVGLAGGIVALATRRR